MKNYDIGDILKEKYTNKHFMIIKENPDSIINLPRYYVQFLNTGEIIIYDEYYLSFQCQMVQKGQQNEIPYQ